MCIGIQIIGLASGAGAWGQSGGGFGTTVQGDAFRNEGRFLRGMAWYELSEARANAIQAEAVIAWNRAVQADYNFYLNEEARRSAAKRAASNERVAEATRRLETLRRRWREQPTVEDIRSGVALNALASDLADPKFTVANWRGASVELPSEVTIQSLAFRFANAPRLKLPARLAPSTVAVGRMKGDRWPVSLRRVDLEGERAAYQRAVAAVVAACAAGKSLRVPEVDTVRDTLFALKDKAAGAVPANGGQRKQAMAFLDQLDEATKIFLDREFAEELIRDVELHKAKTVGELLGFMKKYRLLFAEGDENPEVWAVYKTLYGLLRSQKASLDVVNANPPEKGDDMPR
jgi:hypothetical protein